MKKTTLMVFLLASFGFAESKEKKISLIQVAEGKPIAGLTWEKKEILSESEGRVILTGKFTGKDRTLLLHQKSVIMDKDGVFTLVVQLNKANNYSFFKLESKKATKDILSQTVFLGIEESDHEAKLPNDTSKIPPVQAVTDWIEEEPKVPLRWEAFGSTGFRFFSISQPAMPDVSQISMPFMAGGKAVVYKDCGVAGFEADVDAFFLKSADDGRNLRTLSMFPNVSYRSLPIEAGLGVRYLTSYANIGSFGYSDLISPTLSLELNHPLSDRITGAFLFRYGMAKTRQSEWSITNAEWVVEGSVRFKDLLWQKPMGFFLRFNSLSLHVPNGDSLYRHSGLLLGARFYFNEI